MSVSNEVKALALSAFRAKGTFAYTAARAEVCEAMAASGVSDFMVSPYADAVIKDAGDGFPAVALADAVDAGTEKLAENALKAERLNELHAWMVSRYEQAVAMGNYAEEHFHAWTLFFIETGLNPSYHQDEAARFEFRINGEEHAKAAAARADSVNKIVQLLEPTHVAVTQQALLDDEAEHERRHGHLFKD